MTGVGFAALGWIESEEIPRGNPYRLINAIDWQGQLCGLRSAGQELRLHRARRLRQSAVKTDYNKFVCKNDPTSRRGWPRRRRT